MIWLIEWIWNFFRPKRRFIVEPRRVEFQKRIQPSDLFQGEDVNAIEAIDKELARLHEELDSLTNPEGDGYMEILELIGRLNAILGQVAMEQLRQTSVPPSINFGAQPVQS